MHWLSGFVDAGLMFAGITDWFGTGMLLAEMPWNQRGVGSSCLKQNLPSGPPSQTRLKNVSSKTIAQVLCHKSSPEGAYPAL